MDSSGSIAQLRLEPKTCNVKHITFYTRNLRFKCKRCATFCCKLGSPKLSANDVIRLKQAGYNRAEFIDSAHSSLKNWADGSCVLLQFNKERNVYECLVYDSRPILCRLYPFYFQETSPNLFILEIMPCRGISRLAGEPVNERFFVNHLRDLLHEFVSAKFY